jgi:hypothetical protein
MSFEIAPNASLQEHSIPADFTTTSKTLYGVERFMYPTNGTNGIMVWTPWLSTMTSPTVGQTNWLSSPSNDSAGGGVNHKFDFVAYAYDNKRIYTTGVGRIVNTLYPTNKVSFADYSALRTSESTFPNIAFSKCNGSFPTAISPQGIACTNDAQKIMVIGKSGNTTYIMGSTDYGNNWFSMPVPTSLSSLYASVGSIACDGNFFYVLTNFTLAKISANFNSDSIAGDWTQIDFTTSSSAPNYVSGYSNLRIFNIDHTDTNKLYIFAYSNSNNVEGYGGGVFVSTDTVNWTLTRFSTLSPLRFTTYIADISFANRFGNKIVVTANFNQFNNDNRRYLFYTSDLTGKTGWASAEPTVMDRANYYDIISTCITPDNRYFVFDRLGSVYYTSDLSGTFTKASTGAGEQPYDGRVYFIDGSEYTRNAYGNAAYNSPEVISTEYASDSFNASYSSEARKWTKRNLTFSGWGGVYADDSYSNEPVDLGFTWNYNGSAYTSFRLNTNGQLHFSSFDSSTGIGPGDKIVANFGDLWFQPNLINTNPSVTVILSDTTVTPLALRTTYAIDTVDSIDGSILFSLDTQTGTQVAKWIMIKGYYTTSNQYVDLGNLEALVDNEGHRLYFGVPLSQITSFAITYLNSYAHYYKTFFPNHPLTKQLNNNGHGVWTKNLSWVDGGVQHNIFRMAVICGEYLNNQRDRSYRVSLYKAGASQKISISALSKFSGFRHSRASNTDKNCGPYPAASANAAALKAQIDYTETTWYSDDNGVTWFLNNKDSTNKSTVVQMGPPLGVTSNISLNTNKLYLSANRTNLYAATDAWDSGIFAINRNTFGYPEDPNIKIGPNMASMILRYIVGERSSSVFGETQMFNAIGSEYSVTINKDSYTFKHGDITRDGSIDTSDVIDMQRITAGLTPYDEDSVLGAQRLVEYLLNNYPSNVIDAAYTYGWIAPNTTQMSSIISLYGMLPGIKNLTTSKTSNVSLSALSELGPIYHFNVYDKYEPTPNSKSTYKTASSTTKNFKA